MRTQPSEEQMMKAIHILMQDDKEYKESFIKDMSDEEYKAFIKECPEFLEDM